MKWFRHDVNMNSNRKIRKLIRVHGATGYAFWCILLEKIYLAEGDFQIQADELWFEDISEDLRLGDYRTPIRILDTLSELGLISSQLWQEHVIFLPAVAERGDAYLNKRVAETEKKRKQRANKTSLSPGDKIGTKGQKGKMSPSDPDPDPDPDPEEITNSLTLTADAEFGELFLENSENTQEHSTFLEPAKPQQTSSIDSNSISGEEKDSAAPRSTITNTPQLKTHKPEPWGDGYERQQGNRDRAQSSTWFKSGLANKRWKDRQDFDKFVAYVESYAENRRKDPELNPDGTKYGKDYRIAILSRTASTQDENDSMLVCWKTWNLEPSAPNYFEPKSEEVAIADVVAEAAFQMKFAKLKADNQAKREAVTAEKVRKDEIIRGLHES